MERKSKQTFPLCIPLATWPKINWLCMWRSTCGLCPVLLFYASALRPVPHCLNYCSFSVFQKPDGISTPALFFIFQNSLVYSKRYGYKLFPALWHQNLHFHKGAVGSLELEKRCFMPHPSPAQSTRLYSGREDSWWGGCYSITCPWNHCSLVNCFLAFWLSHSAKVFLHFAFFFQVPQYLCRWPGMFMESHSIRSDTKCTPVQGFFYSLLNLI